MYYLDDPPRYMMMMKFLLHSWLRPDGTCTDYVYYVTSDILDPSENAPLSLAGVLVCCDLLKKQPRNDERTTRIGSVISGVGQLRISWLLVSEGEFPVVDSLCNGDVDEVVQYNRTGNCLFCFVPTYLIERPSFPHFLLPLTPPLHLTNLPLVLRRLALSRCPVFRLWLQS